MLFLSRTFQKTFPAPALARLQTTLILAEHDNSRLSPVTLHAITAAVQLGVELHCLVAGTGCGEVIKELVAVANVARVLLADHAAYKDADQLAPVMVSAQRRFKLSHILAGASTFSVMFLAAAHLDVPVMFNSSTFVLKYI